MRLGRAGMTAVARRIVFGVMKALKRKIGISKKVDDDGWKALKKEFDAHCEDCSRIGKAILKHRQCLEQFVPSLLTVAESFNAFYKDTDDEHRSMAAAYSSTAGQINAAMQCTLLLAREGVFEQTKGRDREGVMGG